MDVPPVSSQLGVGSSNKSTILPPSVPRKKRRIWLWLILGIILAVIIAAGVMGYLVVLQGKTKWGAQLQDKVWQNFVENSGTKPSTQDVSISYQDSGRFEFVPSKVVEKFYAEDPQSSDEYTEELKTEADKYAFTLDQLKFALTSSGFANFSDPSNPQADTASKASVSNGGKEYSANLDFKLQDKTGLLKYDISSSIRSTELGKQLLSSEDNYLGKWIEVIHPDDTYALDDVKKSFDEAKPYRDILRDNRFVSIKSFKGISRIDGQWTAHYELQFDKEKFKTVVKAVMDKSNLNSSDNVGFDFVNQLNDIFIDKMEVKNYEVWIGLKDKELYKSSMTTNALSITKSADSVYQKFLSNDNNPVQQSLKDAREKSRNAKRLADMRQSASALELYFNDNNGYPVAVNGQPTPLLGTYFAVIPTSPTPTDPPCTDYNNTYWYEPSGTPTKQNGPNGLVTVYPGYTYYFCLSEDTGGLKAGTQRLTQGGIVSDNGYTPTNPQPAVDYEKQITDLILDTVRQLSWDAEVKINTTAKGYGAAQKVDLPTNFIDPDNCDRSGGLGCSN